MRSRFYEQFEEGEDRSISLDDAARRFVQYEATQSCLQGSGGSVSSASGKRSAEGSLPPAKKKTVSSTLRCWICGSTQHTFNDCFRKKETGCASCGGSCNNVRKCPKSWFYLNPQRGKSASSSSSSSSSSAAPAAPEDNGGLRAGRRIPRPAARAIEVLDLTQDVKQVGSCYQQHIVAESAIPAGYMTSPACPFVLAGAGGRLLETLGERSLERLLALREEFPMRKASVTPVLPPLLSLSSRDMLVPFVCNGHRGTALIDTGATTSYVDPSFLEVVNVTPIERTRVCVVRLADGTTRFVHSIAILDISLSKKWPILRICALPMKQGGQPLLLGADWAQRLGIRIE